MRVTQTMIANQTLRHIQSNYSQISKYQDQLATGKKISRASQDPVAATSGMFYRTQVREIEQFQRNISSAQTWVETSDQAVYDVNLAMQRVRELTVQASNDTYDETQRAAVAEEIAQIIDHIADVGNTQVNKKYIFNGTDAGEKPIAQAEFDMSIEQLTEMEGQEEGSIDGAVLYYEGNVYVWSDGAFSSDNEDLPDISIEDFGESVDPDKAVLFGPNAIQMNGENVNLELMKDVEIPVNVNGNDVFSHQMFGDLILLQRAMTDEEADIGHHLQTVDEHMDDILTVEAQIGAKQNRIDLTEARMDQQFVTATRIMSDNEDADISAAIINLVIHESVLNASLGAGARIMQPSLMDFLR
ncbi:flagellar hook-associated protein FlgL [Geomicrobium sp. JCM 19037]|uniref:flagellar hook-associated protein FlgL n=1 Tax=Geomicrobium sp. JCM 19037 TaxID=1460634 RepID=UPI00045F3A3F|nr:flagellar hook-associated protein FlgL [Geomicrobium sp. JCM 19037]GAK02594.1 flagellar hook-associated protein FlgL [Geomicrobium sp. JCM 19037]